MDLSARSGYLSKNFGLKKAVDIMKESGFDAIDFSAQDKEFYGDAHDKTFYTEIRKYAEDKGIYFNQSHAPCPTSFENEDDTKMRFHDVVNAMKNASFLGVENIVVHPCQHLSYEIRDNTEKLFEINMRFYKSLIPYAEEFGIKIAVENMWQHKGMITHSTCSRPEEFIRYVDTLANDSIVACLDIGHATLVREKADIFIKKLGSKRLKCLHVHDVDGIDDLHTVPYMGIVNWNEVIEALAEIKYEGQLTLETDYFYKNKPVELAVENTAYMAAVGRHLVRKFENAIKQK